MRPRLWIARLRLREALGLERRISRLDLEQTLALVVSEPLCVSRFGDGEFNFLLKRRGVPFFQGYDPGLAERLLRALCEPNPRVLRCFNNSFLKLDTIEELPGLGFLAGPHEKAGDGVLRFDRRSQRNSFAKRWAFATSRSAVSLWGDACFMRLGLYVDAFREGRMDEVKARFRSLFAGRRILFVAPRTPLAGPSFRELAPDLKALGAREVRFLDIPPTEAYSSAEAIRDSILSERGVDEVFIQAGPLATVLSFELASLTDARLLDVGALNCFVRQL